MHILTIDGASNLARSFHLLFTAIFIIYSLSLFCPIAMLVSSAVLRYILFCFFAYVFLVVRNACVAVGLRSGDP